MKIKEIVIASGNKGKVAEFEKMLSGLGISVYALSEFDGISEYQETGHTFQENASGKALYYSNILGKVVIADDSGLEVDALDGAPGVYSARYAGCEGPEKDSANNARLLQELIDVPDSQRTARFRCCLCMAGPDGVLAQASGSVEGHICRTGRGANGFGYDPLFEIPELGRTAAELEYSEKNRISHRGKAMKELMVKLKELIESELC